MEPHRFTVDVETEGICLHWDVSLSENAVREPSTRPRRPPALRPPYPVGLAVIGRAAGLLLRAGRVRLSGTVPSRQEFFADLRRIWLIEDSTALIGGVDVGEPGPLPEQAHLADFWLSQRGLFAIGASFFELYEAGRHLQVASRSEVRGAATPRDDA